MAENDERQRRRLIFFLFAVRELPWPRCPVGFLRRHSSQPQVVAVDGSFCLLRHLHVRDLLHVDVLRKYSWG